MNIDLIAQLKNYEDFLESYKDGDESLLYNGKSLIFFSLSNTDVVARYKISDFLLRKNINVFGVNFEKHNVFHVLLGQKSHDIIETTDLCKRLLINGADINGKDRNNQVPIDYVIRINKTDIELTPLYDLFFSISNLDLETEDVTGCTPIQIAKEIPYRKILVERMESYVA